MRYFLLLLVCCLVGCETTTPTDPTDAKIVLVSDAPKIEAVPVVSSPPPPPPVHRIPSRQMLAVRPYIVKGGWCGEGGLLMIACYLTGCTPSRALLRQQEAYLDDLQAQKSINTDEICPVAEGFWGMSCGFRGFGTVEHLKEQLALGSPLLMLIDNGYNYHALVVYGYDEQEFFFHDTTGPANQHKSYRTFMRLIAGSGYTFVERE